MGTQTKNDESTSTLDAGSAPDAETVKRAEIYVETFCSLAENSSGEASTRLHAAVLLHELRSVRRYCGALENQLDGFGLKAAQRSAGLDKPNKESNQA